MNRFYGWFTTGIAELIWVEPGLGDLALILASQDYVSPKLLSVMGRTDVVERKIQDTQAPVRNSRLF